MKEVAAALRLTLRTVETHKYEMMQALGLRTTAYLIRYALAPGPAEPRPPVDAVPFGRSLSKFYGSPPECSGLWPGRHAAYSRRMTAGPAATATTARLAPRRLLTRWYWACR